MSPVSRKNLLDDLPEVFVSTTATTLAVSRSLAAGRIRKIGPRLYTKNLTDPPETVIRRRIWQVVGALLPGALIADRTALEHRPAEDGSVFVVSDHRRDIELPGLRIRPRRGASALDSDEPYFTMLRVSSRPRAFLDNLARSRQTGHGVPRTLGRGELEDRLDAIARINGIDALNALRDEARRIAPLIGREAEYTELDYMIGSLQGTKSAALTSARARARAAGTAYDPRRLDLFAALHAELRSAAPVGAPAHPRTRPQDETLAFFEAYFSNFIEGTEFDVGEAAEIVFQQAIPVARPADAHDVLGTWEIVSDPREMARTPSTPADLLDLLRRRHAVLMSARPDVQPGVFKETANRAGTTLFVAPDEVVGTLTEGFEFYRNLPPGLARAIFMMFLVSEVHPFVDGNGRVARIMMNAELVAAREERIVIPTISRGDYLTALKALSVNSLPTPLILTLTNAQRWVGSVPWTTVDETRGVLEQLNAFADSITAERQGIKLAVPGSADRR